MRSVVWFVVGFLTAAAVAVIGSLVLLNKATHGFSANAQPTAVEVWGARKARELALPNAEKQRTNPVPNTPKALSEARAHWADHCAVCHANDGSGQAQIGEHMYPRAPDMGKGETQELTDGELFYIIQNGIRLSGMPAWGAEHSGEEDSWKLVRFIRHLPNLSETEIQEMEKLNPKSPEEWEEQQQEEQFLKGQQPAKSSTSDHQHH
jgi:mono/diheme cytochrome c family protein